MIDRVKVARVQEFHFSGTIIREDLSWTGHIPRLVGKAH